MRLWRLIDTGCRSAAENMALDDVILECRAKNLIPNTIRFLQFSPPAVLVGYHQSVEQEVRIEYCREKGIDINRRLTGGGAIFFDEKSLGWEIIASKEDLNVNFPSEKVFEYMCRGAVLGLRNLGIKASFRPKNDIEVDGRKISGTGGTERGEAFLFQGTLLVDFDVETMIKALKIPVIKLRDKEIESVKQRVTSIKLELDYCPAPEEIKDALRRGFEEAFNIKLVSEKLSDLENTLLRERLSRFKSKEWIFLDRLPINETAEISAVKKTYGGLIRASLAVDKREAIIKSILITGDFFIFPLRAIIDLEAALKDSPCNPSDILRTVKGFFKKNRVYMPGVKPEDLAEVIIEAVKKISYEKIGIKAEEANHIYAVNGEVVDVLNGGCDVLLLPYCAKPPTCKYRWEEGCIKCGGCTVGQAYELAEKAGLKPITIQNFEHLMDVLAALRESGVKGYIGCCCEAFYCKHQRDLEEAGIPGIIIDIDDKTCYELGLEDQALKGAFNRQTRLRINILSKMIDMINCEGNIGKEKLRR